MSTEQGKTGNGSSQHPGETVPDSSAPVAPSDKTVLDSDAGLAAPRAIPGYEIGQMLGKDPMGAVYLAKRIKDQADVALKVMLAELADHDPAKDMFAREIKVMSGLGHDNIVAIYDHGSAGTVFYFVMEFCPGGNLMDLMNRRGGKLSLDEAGPLAIQALEGLCHAHKKGYVHRNIKPANILLSARSAGTAKIGGFGLAKNFEATETSGIRKTGQVGGTLPYMPREQLTNFEYLKPVSDVWSMGATLYVALTGQLPRDFRPGQGPVQVVLRQPVVPIRNRDSNIPESVARVIDHSLQDKDHRYQTAEEFRQALVTVLDSSTPDFSPDATVLEPDSGAPPSASLPADADPICPEEDRVASEWQVDTVILDLYEVRAVLGKGGFGKVHRVHHRGWNLDLAVKSPHDHMFRTDALKKTFVGECEAWINLGLHPHTVSCYYVRTIDEVPRVFAECVEGGSLHAWIWDGRLYEGGPDKALERILDIAIQFAWGLQHAHEHEQGMIHQDIKPENVMMTPEGVAKVTDFGLARARPADEVELADSAGGTVLLKGQGMTIEYRSPEQARGTELSRKTDLWSWAVSLLEMFIGGRTWMLGEMVADNLQGYLEAETGQEFRCNMPAAVAELLQGCFRHNPDERPGGMGEVADRLQEAYREVTGAVYPRVEPKAAELRADSLNNKALAMLDLEQEKEAVVTWEQALEVDPHHTEATYNLGLWRWRKATLTDEELLQELESISSLSDDWRPQYLLGLIHLERGDGWAAQTALNNVLQLAPAESEFHKAQELLEQVETNHDLRTFKGDTDEIRSIAISPDGLCAVSGSDDNTLRLWELETGRCLRIFEGHERPIESVAISPDGKHIVSGGVDNTVRIWSLTGGQCLNILKGHGERIYIAEKHQGDPFRHLSAPSVNTVAITPDGRYVLSGADDGTARLWEFKSGICLRIFKGHSDELISVAISPDGRYFVSGSEDATLRLWELETGRCLRIFEGHKGGISSVAITSDGSNIVSGSADTTLRLWKLINGNCIHVMEGYLAQGVITVAVTPDDQYALSGNEDTTVRLWELKSGRCIRTFEVHNGSVMSVAVTLDGCFVLSGSRDATLKVWRLHRINADWALNRPVSVSDLSGTAATVSNQKELALAKLKSGIFCGAGAVLRRALSTPGFERDPQLLELWRQAGIGGGRRIGLRMCRCLRIDDIPGRYEFKTFGNVIAISPNGKYAVLGTLSHTVQLWDLESGKCVRILEGHKDIVSAIAISLDGRYVLSGSWDETIRLWDIASGTCLQSLTGHDSQVNAVAVTPDHRHVLSVSDLDLRIWHLKSGRCIRVIDWGGETEDELNKIVAFSPDFRYAVLAGYTTIRLMDIENETCLRVFEGHENSVTAITLTPDMRYIVSGSDDNTVRLWEVENGVCLGTFKGHTYPVKAVAISPDGRYALSGSEDYTLRLWDLHKKENLHELEGHKGCVEAISFTPDAHHVVSAGGVTLRHWELDWDYEYPDAANWDEGAMPYLELFLTLHCPCGPDGLSRAGKPSWNDEDFHNLLKELQYRGFGWLRPVGVRKKLEEMAANLQEPSFTTS